MTLELTCEVTQMEYTLTGDGVPRLLPECGCTLSTKCIRDVLAMVEDGPFLCPVSDCGEENPKKASAEDYSKNGALMKVLRKTNSLLLMSATASEKSTPKLAAKKPSGLSFSMAAGP